MAEAQKLKIECESCNETYILIHKSEVSEIICPFCGETIKTEDE